ncbi:hypothetical protein KR026_004132 [Drosophila bipectinata]|nr:hypothetical protein KR026_004132 [Drosophila bipectinata]
MKFILVLSILVLYLAYTYAQEDCQGKPRLRQNCIRGKDEGHFNQRACRRNANANMWYFDERANECKKMRYHGCAGNRNRYCSLRHCNSRCRRR